MQGIVMDEDANRALRRKQVRGMINHPAQLTARIVIVVGSG